LAYRGDANVSERTAARDVVTRRRSPSSFQKAVWI
jgi:hypothetical protein